MRAPYARYFAPNLADSGSCPVVRPNQVDAALRVFRWDDSSDAQRSTSVSISPIFLKDVSSKWTGAEYLTETDLVRLQGIPRLRLLWKLDPISAGVIVAGILGASYLAINCILWLIPFVASIILPGAHAQNGGSAGGVPGSSRDPFDWLVAALMGAVLAAAVYAALFSKEQKRMSFGMDTTKTIVGFIIGFLSGGKGRV